MKKIVCFFVMISLGYGLFAFDRSLIGSWGLIANKEKEEFVRFNANEMILINETFSSGDYIEGDNTIYISDFDGDSVIIQYYLLSPNTLLFILWNTDDPIESITLILSRL